MLYEVITDARDFRMGDGQNIVNGKNSTSFITTPSNINISKALNPDSIEGKKYFIVGNGWSTHDLGFVMEANLEFNPYFSLLLSARADKNTYSDWLFSPRAAIISELNDNHVVKLVLQQSNKINTAEQLYIANRTNSTGDVESVTTTELIYTGLVSDHSLINFSTYLNQQSAIGWNPGTKSTTPIADLSIAGFEFDYQLKAFSVFAGFSHAYTKLLNYSLKENVPHTFLSYSEFSLPKTTEEIGSGKGLIGISENTTKLYIDKFLMNRKFALHTELATFWSFNGSKGVQNVVVNA